MGVITCKVFNIEYTQADGWNTTSNTLVLADSMEEALDIFKEKYPKYDIQGIHTYIPIIRRTTKTITVEL